MIRQLFDTETFTLRTALAGLLLVVAGLLLPSACSNDGAQEASTTEVNNEEEELEQVPFDRSKWLQMEDDIYLFRAQMIDDVLYNDTIRDLSQTEIEALLGSPDRFNDGFAYYTINRKKWGMMTLHASTMVIKYANTDSIEWIKLHE